MHPGAVWFGVDEGFDLCPVLRKDGLAVDGRLACLAGQHDAAHAVYDPGAFLGGPVANALVSSDDDKVMSSDDREPVVVDGASGNFGQLEVAGEHHIAMLSGERLTERQVGFVDEVPGGHYVLGRQ